MKILLTESDSKNCDLIELLSGNDLVQLPFLKRTCAEVNVMNLPSILIYIDHMSENTTVRLV